MTYFDDELIVASAKRALAPPAQFSVVFPGATDADVAGLIADGFGLARLAGFFAEHTFDSDSLEVTPDLSDAGVSLVLCYMVSNALGAKLLQLSTVGGSTRYKAGPVETETNTQPLASVLSALLKRAQDQIAELSRNGRAKACPIWYDAATQALSRTSLAPTEVRTARPRL